MLEWKEIKGYNHNFNYKANMEAGVDLPELNEYVLFCKECPTSYVDNGVRNVYFGGYICLYGRSENPVVADVRTNGIWTLEDGTKWARFNLPETSNNLRYAIACLDQEGNNFYKGIPYLINVGKEKDRIKEAVEKLKKENYKEITPFKYIEPCTFQYDWKYVKENAIIVN